jgi:hypothetical protein
MGAKISKERFLERFYERYGDSYTVVSDYTLMKNKVSIKCNKCGKVYAYYADYILNGNYKANCTCSRVIYNKITDKNFKKRFHELYGDAFTVVSEYKGIKEKVEIKCNKCGFVFTRIADHLLNGKPTLTCGRKLKSNLEERLLEKIKQNPNEKFEIVEFLPDKRVKLKCKKCKRDFVRGTENAFYNYNKIKCPNEKHKSGSGNKNQNRTKKTDAQFKKEVSEKGKGEYVAIGKYIKGNTKIKMKHLVCGHEYMVTPDHFINGTRCPKCFGNRRKSNEQFLEEVRGFVGDEYTFLEKYINAKTKLKVRHNKCGNVYEVRPNDFLKEHGQRCPACKTSRGEKRISKYLDAENIVYETQRTFDDLRIKRPLQFDFFLPYYNAIIEYDGRQHYEPAAFGGISKERAEKHFKERQRRDKMKNDFCKKKGMEMIRIPYTDFDAIEEILNRKLPIEQGQTKIFKEVSV